jgi:hypothetical protein
VAVRLPYGMHLFMHLSFLCAFGYECLDTVQFGCSSSFKATRIVENELGVASKDHIVLDIVKSTLMVNQLVIGKKYTKSTIAEGATTEDSI